MEESIAAGHPQCGYREAELEKTGVVSCAEAREIAKRYNASHFSNHRDMGERARYTIPVDFRRDDDVRLSAFISQVEKAQEDAARESSATRLTEQNRILAYLAPYIGETLAEEIRAGKHLEGSDV